VDIKMGLNEIGLGGMV